MHVSIFKERILTLKEVEKISKALADISRLEIIKAIQSNGGKIECTTIVSLLSLAQPSISHHIKKLVDAELIHPRKEGRFYFYSLNEDILTNYLKTLNKL